MMRSGGGVLEGSRGPITFPHHPIYPPVPEFLRPLPPRYRPPHLPPTPTRLKEDEETTNFPYRVYPYPYPYPYLYPLVRPLEYPSYASPPQSPLVRKPRPTKEKRVLRRSRAGPSAGFARGSLIRLASGELRRVEEMRTEDFISSADASPALRLDPSTVVRIVSSPENTSAVLTLSYGQDRTQVEVECSTEHPYFVYGQGWASCHPERTQAAYGLKVHQLQVGDVCISLTPRPGVVLPGQSNDRKRRWSAPDEIQEQHPIVVND